MVRRLFTGVSLAFVLLLAACAPTREAAPAPSAKEPQYGGSLVFSGRYGVETLHPFKVGTSSPLQRTIGMIYESPLRFKLEQGEDYRVNYEVAPGLVERWEQPDDRTYIFHLRRGVKWHDGQPFTAEDMLFTYDWVQREKFVIRANYQLVASMEKLDDYTLKVVLKAPSAFFLEDMAGTVAYIAPKHIYERGEDFSKVAIGTGPFKLKSYDRTTETLLARNESYWQQGRPYLDEIREIWGLDQSTETASFIAGKSDLLLLLDRLQLDGVLKARPEALYDARQADNGTSLVMQLDKPPFNDIRVRRALHLVVDRQAMLNTLTRGDGSINPPGVQGWKTGWAIPQEELLKLPGYRQPKDQDIAEARRLLAEAGYPNGFKFTIPQSKDAPVPLPISEMMAAQFRAVGVEMAIDLKDGASFTQMDKDGQFDAEVWVNFKASLRDNLPNRYHSKGSLNKIGLSDPKLDELLDAIPTTLDVGKRKQVVLEIQRYLLEKLYFVPTIEFAVYEVRQPWVHDFRGLAIVIMTVDHLNAPYIWLDQGRMPSDRR